MIITCPKCSTQFSVPDRALGGGGRTLKCARCAHKWFQTPEAGNRPQSSGLPLEMEPQPMRPTPPAPDIADIQTVMADHIRAQIEATTAAMTAAMAAGGSDDTLKDNPGRDAPPASGNDFDEDSTLQQLTTFVDRLDSSTRRAGGAAGGGQAIPDLMSDIPEPIPEIFSSPHRKPPRRRGGVVLILVLLGLMVAGTVASAFFYQDRIIAQWPEANQLYSTVGLRREQVGAGLVFRNYSSERLVQGETEVLVVRGIIANGTTVPRDVPLLRLALYDHDALVQEKVVNPPVPGLEPGGAVGFRITLEQPNPAASRFQLDFTQPKEQASAPAQVPAPAPAPAK